MDMSIENQAAQPVTETPAPEAASHVEAPRYDPEVVERAKATGWRPVEEFKGDPERHIPPDEWNRRTDEILPIAQSVNKKLVEQVTDLTRKLNESQKQFESRVAAQERMTLDALARQRAQIHEQYEGAKRAAAERGDVQAFDNLEAAKRDKLKDVWDQEQAYKKEVDAPREQAANAPHPDVQSWVERNTWFKTDPVLARAAEAFHVDLRSTKPGLSVAENLAAVEKRVRAAFPEKFGDTGGDEPAPRVSAVEGGGGRVPASRGGNDKLAAKLPPEAVQAADRFIKQGLYKDRAEYAKAYFEQ